MASLWTKFTDIFSRTKSGVVPQAPSGTGTTKYLREDGVWAVPSGGGGGGSSTLADLEDVNLNNPSDGQILSYNATTEMWENKSSGNREVTTEDLCVWTNLVNGSETQVILSKPITDFDAINIIYKTSNSFAHSQILFVKLFGSFYDADWMFDTFMDYQSSSYRVGISRLRTTFSLTPTELIFAAWSTGMSVKVAGIKF